MLIEAKYKHWDGLRSTIWGRRGVIAWQGFKSALTMKSARFFITMGWATALAQTAILFFIGQLLVEDSLVFLVLEGAQGPIRGIARGLITWLVDHPEISVRATHTLLFYFFASWTMPLAIVIGLVAVPNAISRDLASNAILVYQSKAVNRLDYLMGKWASLFGLMSMTWFLPLAAAWFFGNLMAPSWTFFWHSKLALFRLSVFAIPTMSILAILMLGVSALNKRPASTIAIWLAIWIAPAAFLVPIAYQTKDWLRFLSFTHNLKQFASGVFQLGKEFELVEKNIPVFGDVMSGAVSKFRILDTPDVGTAILALGLMIILASVTLWRKVRPQ